MNKQMCSEGDEVLKKIRNTREKSFPKIFTSKYYCKNEDTKVMFKFENFIFG